MNPKIFSALFLAGSLSSQAAISSVSTSTPTSSAFFTDNAADYFGIVASANGTGGGVLTGGSIARNSTYQSATGLNPVVGSLAGRDHDDADTKPGTVQALWTLGLPSNATPGTGFTNIRFVATLAATETSWGNGITNGVTTDPVDEIKFELLINGFVAANLAFRPNAAAGGSGALAIDTNNDGVGDGTLISASGTMVPNLTNVGGATVTSVQLRATYAADSGSTAHWTLGTLSADSMVPEPSLGLLFGLGGLGLLARRSRNGHKS